MLQLRISWHHGGPRFATGTPRTVLTLPVTVVSSATVISTPFYMAFWQIGRWPERILDVTDGLLTLSRNKTVYTEIVDSILEIVLYILIY